MYLSGLGSVAVPTSAAIFIKELALPPKPIQSSPTFILRKLALPGIRLISWSVAAAAAA